MIEQILKIDWITLIVGVVVGWGFPIIPKLIGILIQRPRLAIALRKIAQAEDSVRAEILSTDRNEYKPDSIEVKDTKCEFYISFPQNRTKELTEYYSTDNHLAEDFFEIHDDKYLDGSSNFTLIEEETGIKGICELINESRQSIADQFLEGKNGAFFNRGKYGISKIKFLNRSGVNEDRHLELSVYKTDYFTSKVMRDVFRKLYPDRLFPNDVSINFLNQHRSFLTSFGINALVTLDDKKFGSVAVFAERSRLASETKKPGIYHITMNEALNLDDYDSVEGKIRLSNCLDRGLWEELGLNNDFYSGKMTSEFNDLFFVTDAFELGISVSAHINDMNFAELLQHARVAKDKKLEIGKLEAVALAKKPIERFMKKYDMIPYSRLIVSMMCARKKIYLDPSKVMRVR